MQFPWIVLVLPSSYLLFQGFARHCHSSKLSISAHSLRSAFVRLPSGFSIAIRYLAHPELKPKLRQVPQELGHLFLMETFWVLMAGFRSVCLERQIRHMELVNRVGEHQAGDRMDHHRKSIRAQVLQELKL